MKNIKENIKTRFKNSPDITFKDYPIKKTIITFIYSNSVSSSFYINEYILKRLDEDINNIKINSLYNYIKNYIPNNSLKEIKTIDDAIYYILSGFTLIIIKNKMIAFENRASLNSNIQKSTNEVSLKGPSLSFTENYETNFGLIRKRLKTDKLSIKENIVGSESKTRVALFYLEDKVNLNIVNDIDNKIKNINIPYVGNTNYIFDAITNSKRSILPISLTTERPDYVTELLLEGRICIMTEYSNEVIILPCMLIDFIKRPDDYYEKSLNVLFNRIIRIIAFLLAIFTPAIYISLMTYNLEIIPSGLLINFSIQRDGVPFSTVFEIIVMNFMFQILRESDLRFPGKGGSSISIVGALVLGQAAVEAGIASPITIIIVGIASVSSLAFSSIELINSIRWIQLFLIVLASLFGFIGVIFGTIILIALLVSSYSLHKPYFYPFLPFNKKAQNNAILAKEDSKFNINNLYEDDNDENK